MLAVNVEIRRFVDDHQPGWIECWLTDANGREWSFVEKVPIVSGEWLDAESGYPRPGAIGCQIVERIVRADDREVVIIDTERPDGVAAITGETRFIVHPEQLVDLD